MALRNTPRFFWAQRRFLALIFVLAAMSVAWSILNRDTIAAYLSSYNHRNQLRGEVGRLEEETADLEREHLVLKQGGFETEKVARERFRFSKPGEEVLYLDPQGTPAPGR